MNFSIEDWMISEKKLGGYELLTFALIHSVTQGGNGCWYGGYDMLAERVGCTKRNVISVVKRLVERGLLEKSTGEFAGEKKTFFSSLVERGNDLGEEEVKKLHQGSEKISPASGEKISPHNNLSNNNTPSREDNKLSPLSTPSGVEGAADRIYKVYPAKCPVKGRPTGKSKADKKKVERALKEYDEKQLIGIINRYVKDCIDTQTPIKNFATFLNNIPDYGEDGGLFEHPWAVEGELYDLKEVATHLGQAEYSHLPIPIKRELVNGGKVRYVNGKLEIPENDD